VQAFNKVVASLWPVHQTILCQYLSYITDLGVKIVITFHKLAKLHVLNNVIYHHFVCTAREDQIISYGDITHEIIVSLLC
jgi:hypothetical protein